MSTEQHVGESYAAGRVDLRTAPVGIVTVDPTGYANSLKEGETTLKALTSDGKIATAKIVVTDLVRDVPINFASEVVPVFTRFGCNAGGCHGKSGGQNGFALSLLGFEPDEDYEFLVKEARGRRIFPSSAEHSLLLTKATGTVAHGGGKKLPLDSAAYRILHRWIEQGTPKGSASDPTVVRIDVQPEERILERESRQQLRVLAHFSDGGTRDVTRLAQFESNDTEIATVSETGLVQSKTSPGTAAVSSRR